MPDCLRVLIAEDSEDDALLIVNELELAGFEVHYRRVQTSETMEEALSSCEWDLILSDYRMPRFSGKEALELLKSHGLDIPFILVSGKIGEETAVAAMKAGAHDYVMKDELARLIPAVQRELREAEIRRERRRADDALHKSEFRFRQIYDNAPVMMHSIDKNGIIRNVNLKWLSELGYTRDEVVGRKVDYVMTRESRLDLQANLVHFWTEGKIADVFYQYVKKDGTIIEVILDSTVVHDPVWGEVSLSVVRDITAQRRAESALRESEERYRTIIETMNEGFAIQDANGVITYANNKLCEMLQCSQPELVGHAAGDFLDAFNQTVENLPTIVHDTSYEVTWTGKHGRQVATIMSPRPLFDFRGEFIGSCAVITDISRRKKREEELRRLRGRLELILNSAWEGIVGLDPEGKFTFVNRSAASMLGYEVEELVSSKSHDIWHHSKPDGSPYQEDSCPIYLSLKHGTVHHATDEVFWRKDGSSFDVELAVNPIVEGGSITGTVVTFWDTTSRNQAERAIQEGKETLEAVFNAITESLFVLDRDGRIISLNKTAAQRLDGTVNELIGARNYDILPPDLAQKRKSKHQERVSLGEVARYDDSKGGRVFDNHVYPVFDSGGDIDRLVVFSRDITERRRAEEALLESEKRFRAVFETAQDFIYIKDNRSKLTHVNPTGQKFLGRPLSKLMGKTAKDLFTAEEASYIEDVDRRVLSGEMVETEHSFRVSGSTRTLHMISVPLRDESGTISGICAIARDISDLKKRDLSASSVPDEYASEVMKTTLGGLRVAASAESTVLLLGESGSGKDFFARYIHDHSRRANGPFFSINCAAVASQLAESELFGHERGAFTGASGRKRGLLELAEGGTLLLNEIGELSFALQAKLLTFLDTRRFTRVGGEREISVNARLIAATNRDLAKEVKDGRFRQDLFYRLNVVSITVPPLRERREDIPLLVRDILARLQTELQFSALPIVDSRTMEQLKRYDWPGNVRELRNVLERAMILFRGGDRLELALPSAKPTHETRAPKTAFHPGRSLGEVTDEVIRSFCEEALRFSSGNRKEAARALGISRDSLYRYMKKFGISGD